MFSNLMQTCSSTTQGEGPHTLLRSETCIPLFQVGLPQAGPVCESLGRVQVAVKLAQSKRTIFFSGMYSWSPCWWSYFPWFWSLGSLPSSSVSPSLPCSCQSSLSGSSPAWLPLTVAGSPKEGSQCRVQSPRDGIALRICSTGWLVTS